MEEIEINVKYIAEKNNGVYTITEEDGKKVIYAIMPTVSIYNEMLCDFYSIVSGANEIMIYKLNDNIVIRIE